MPLGLFSSRQRTGAYAARLLFLGAMAPFWFFTTQFLQSVAGYSPVRAGLAFLPVTLLNFAAAMTVPRLTRRFGNATLLVGALVISAIGMAWLGQLSAHSPYLTGIALPMFLIGAGQGGALGPLTAAGIAGVAAEDAGAAGGVMTSPTRSAGRSASPSSSRCSPPPAPAPCTGPPCSRTASRRHSPSPVLLALALLVALIVRPRTAVAVAVADPDPVTASHPLVLGVAHARAQRTT